MADPRPPLPTEFSAETEHALLGEYFARKNRGRSEELSIARDVTLIDCVGNDELATAFQISCELAQVRPFQDGEQPEGTNQTPPVVGLLEWGTDGATVSAEFDFANGTILSVAASSVRLRARFDNPPEGVPADFAIVARAQIGYFTKPSGPATRTLRATVANGAQIAFPVPKFARRVRVVRSPLASTTVELFSVFPAFASIALDGPSVAPEIQLPIPNDARVVVISNNSGAPAEYRAIFDLWI